MHTKINRFGSFCVFFFFTTHLLDESATKTEDCLIFFVVVFSPPVHSALQSRLVGDGSQINRSKLTARLLYRGVLKEKPLRVATPCF